MKPHFRVAAGILQQDDGRVLIAERLGDGPFHGMWEFPGGKIDDGETAGEAVARELEEELGIRCAVAEEFLSLHHDYDDRAVSITFFRVSCWEEQPRGLEGQALRWLLPHELDDACLLPADKPVIEALKKQSADR